MRGIVSETLDKTTLGKKEFFPTFLSHVEAFLKISLKGIQTLIDLFSQESKKTYFQNKNVILMMDEIDSIAEVDKVARKTFFGQLSSIKQSWKDGQSTYCLYSTLVVTNWSGDYLKDTIGNSPFNVSDTIYLDYFTNKEFLDLWSQYERQMGFTVDQQIKQYMFDISEGAPGIVSMLGKYYHESNESNQVPLSYQQWIVFANGFEFWREIESYSNFSRMVSALETDNEKKLILLFMADGLLESLTITESLNNLVKANIFKIKRGVISFASRFVQRFLDLKIRETIPTPQDLPLMRIELNQEKIQLRVDVPKFVAMVAQHMNRGVITSAQKKDNKTSQSKNDPKGPKEIVIEEQRASKSNGQSSTQSCDCFYDFGDFGTILMEHGANLSVTPGLKQRYSLDFHVYDQAEKYHATLHPNWVVHWTTIDRETTYVCPKSNTVSVLHVYHDKLFHHLKVVTKENVIDVENELPALNLKRKQMEHGEESAKDRILEGTLEYFLVESKLEKKNVIGDGYCLFRSISLLLRQNELIVAEILEKCITFQDILLLFRKREVLPLENWPDDELFVLIIARALKIKITVHIFTSGSDVRTTIYTPTDSPATAEMIILNEENIHYNPLLQREVESKSKLEGNIQARDSFLEETAKMEEEWILRKGDRTYSFLKEDLQGGESAIKIVLGMKQKQRIQIYSDSEMKNYLSFEAFKRKPGTYYIASK